MSLVPEEGAWFGGDADALALLDASGIIDALGGIVSDSDPGL